MQRERSSARVTAVTPKFDAITYAGQGIWPENPQTFVK
jgi:hypothetical protein